MTPSEVKKFEEEDIVYRKVVLKHDLMRALQGSREEPGLPLKDVAHALLSTLKSDEVEVLVEELTELENAQRNI